MLEDETLGTRVSEPATTEDEDDASTLMDHVQRVARRPESRFAAGGLVAGILIATAALGHLLPPAGLQDARDDARLAIERLAVVQARLDALDGGHAPAAAAEHGAEADAHSTTEAPDAHASESHEGDEPAEPHWAYEGDSGPGKWASLANEFAACGAGKEQSPVDLAKAEVEGAVDLEFHYAAGAATIVDNGHTIQVDVAEGSYLLLGERRFDLVQFHFHGPSEHTVGGRSYPLEIHFVHKDEQGKLAVVGVMVESGGTNSALGSVLASLPTTPNRPETIGKSVDPSRLLPKQHSSFQYSGSLTTPPCTEGVAWSVLVAPITMGEEQIESLRARLHGGNNRPVQPLNERTLFVDFGAH